MKPCIKIILILIVSLSFTANAQVSLQKKDLDNLVAMAELYSANPMCSGVNFVKSIDSLRTPVLNSVADALIATGKAKKNLLTTTCLKRPGDPELMYWYVIREIHYNNSSKNTQPRPSEEVAAGVLSRKIDSRWLIDNYYYRVLSGVAMLFNTEDLSKENIDVEALGFKDETEKGIFYLNLMDKLVGSRFRVLIMMKNNKRILEFSDRLPTLNGKSYYEYVNFDFEDFRWTSYEKEESFKEVELNIFYSVLMGQMGALVERDKDQARTLYKNSILSKPEYFKYSIASATLQEVYDKYR